MSPPGRHSVPAAPSGPSKSDRPASRMSTRRPSRPEESAGRPGSRTGRPEVPPGRPSFRAGQSVPAVPAAASSQRRPSGKLAEQPLISRQLSFVDATVDQIRANIQLEVPDWKFNGDFWQAVLAGQPALESRVLGNRTLAYWIRAFNRWQARGNPAPGRLDVESLEAVLGIPRQRIKDVVKMFDPHGWNRLEQEGMTESTGSKVKVSALSLLTAGVMLSQLIPPKQKLRFVFGLSDLDDNRGLDEQEFQNFIFALFRGFGAVFNLADQENVMPSPEAIRTLSSRLYSRISSLSAKRLQELAARGTEQEREAMIQAIKQRQAASPSMSRSGQRQRSSSTGTAGKQLLKFDTLERWCFREFHDPLALPYALAIERFCPRRAGSSCSGKDFFMVDAGDWFLSHSSPVVVPKDEDEEQPNGELLQRWQVIFARQIFQWCQEEVNFRVDHWQVTKGLGKEVPCDLWELLGDALPTLSEERSRGIKPTFVNLLHKMCPIARPRHLRMFEVWCQQFDEIESRQTRTETVEEAALRFEANDRKPVLPADEIFRVDKIFQQLDRHQNGCVTVEDVADYFAWDPVTAEEFLSRHDLSEDGCLDREDFLRMMCPDDFRVPAMSGSDREVFGLLLQGQARKLREDLENEEGTFRRGSLTKKDTPVSLLPQVEEETWLFWNQLFDRLDSDGDNYVDSKDLVYSGLVSREVISTLVSIIEPEETMRFSRQSFLRALLDATGSRRAGFSVG